MMKYSDASFSDPLIVLSAIPEHQQILSKNFPEEPIAK